MIGFMKVNKNRQCSKNTRVSTKKASDRIYDIKQLFLINFTLAKMLLITAFIVFGVVFYGSFIAIEAVLEVPVNQVEVKADLNFQAQQEITDIINGYVVNGFVRVDLEQLQNKLLALPWIYQATIKRKLPHGLIVELNEQQPVAYWNNNALINTYGEVFHPVKIPQINGLPALSGNSSAEVLEVYKQLKILLPVKQQPIVALHVADRKTINVTTLLRTELIFNIEKLQEQALLWRQISNNGMGDRLSEVKQADLRYNNGAAVQWKNIVAVGNKTTWGGH